MGRNAIAALLVAGAFAVGSQSQSAASVRSLHVTDSNGHRDDCRVELTPVVGTLAEQVTFYFL